MRLLLLPLLIGVLSTPKAETEKGETNVMPVPPGTKTSPTATGEQTVDITLGEGLYQLYAASIRHTHADGISGRISYIYTEGDGTEIEVTLASGVISKYLPLVLGHTVNLTGPGFFRSTCYHISSMSHIFNVEYRRLSKTELIG